MKSSKVLAAIATALLLTVCLTAAPLQQAPANPPGQAPPAAPNPPAAQDKTAIGQLSKVDVAAKEITIKGQDNKEMVFSYTDATQMSGVDGGAQGLTGKTGSTLRVTYREARGQNIASKIEVGGPGAGGRGEQK
jgi:Cu/Ag efflux protein CusF